MASPIIRLPDANGCVIITTLAGVPKLMPVVVGAVLPATPNPADIAVSPSAAIVKAAGVVAVPKVPPSFILICFLLLIYLHKILKIVKLNV